MIDSYFSCNHYKICLKKHGLSTTLLLSKIQNQIINFSDTLVFKKLNITFRKKIVCNLGLNNARKKVQKYNLKTLYLQKDLKKLWCAYKQLEEYQIIFTILQ